MSLNDISYMLVTKKGSNNKFFREVYNITQKKSIELSDFVRNNPELKNQTLELAESQIKDFEKSRFLVLRMTPY